MKEVGIIDVWRENNPTGRDYPHYSGTHNVCSRIDFFMLKSDIFRLVKCDSGVCTL